MENPRLSRELNYDFSHGNRIPLRQNQDDNLFITSMRKYRVWERMEFYVTDSRALNRGGSCDQLKKMEWWRGKKCSHSPVIADGKKRVKNWCTTNRRRAADRLMPAISPISPCVTWAIFAGLACAKLRKKTHRQPHTIHQFHRKQRGTPKVNILTRSGHALAR